VVRALLRVYSLPLCYSELPHHAVISWQLSVSAANSCWYTCEI